MDVRPAERGRGPFRQRRTGVGRNRFQVCGGAAAARVIAVKRAGKMISLDLVRPEQLRAGVAFADTAVARCSNHCVFCFIDQMPPGLRASLYVKDEDAKHSFVNGNYVTLGAMTYAPARSSLRPGTVAALHIRSRNRSSGPAADAGQQEDRHHYGPAPVSRKQKASGFTRRSWCAPVSIAAPYSRAPSRTFAHSAAGFFRSRWCR